MGWDVKDSGLHVVFSRSIPSIVTKWLRPVVEGFLQKEGVTVQQLSAFIAHPGGRKVLEAYSEALGLAPELLEASTQVLKHHGNMSSPTVLYVLEKVLASPKKAREYGLMAALGPGFSSELLLLQWEEVNR